MAFWMDSVNKAVQDAAAKATEKKQQQQQAADSGDLGAGTKNASDLQQSETSRQVAGGAFGWGHETLKQYGMNADAWNSQASGAQTAISNRYKALTDPNNQAYNAQASTAGPVAMNPEMRQNQSGLANMLMQQAQGQGPSAAQAQLQAGTDAAINSQMAMARSSGNPMAMRQAQFNAATLGQQNANQAAQLRAQEMQQGRALAAQQFEGVRGQDLGQRGQDIQQGQFNAGQLQQTTQFNAQQAMQKEQMISDYVNKGLTLAEANRAAAIDLQKSEYAAKTGQEMAALKQNNDANNQIMDPVFKTAKAVGDVGSVFTGKSDERAKTNVTDGTRDIRGFLDAIHAHKYNYKPEHQDHAGGGGKGTYVSPMAQELEKTKLGKDLVREDASGTKIVDYGKGLGAMLAAIADTHKRLKKLES